MEENDCHPQKNKYPNKSTSLSKENFQIIDRNSIPQPLAQKEQQTTKTGFFVSRSSLESPLVLPADLLLFLGRKVVLNVERLANLLRCFALDHVSHRLASQVQQALYVQIVCSL